MNISEFDTELAGMVKKIQHYPVKYPEFNGGCTGDEPVQVIDTFKPRKHKDMMGYINGKPISQMTLEEYKWVTRFRKPVPVPHRYDLLEYYPKKIAQKERDKEQKLVSEFKASCKYKYGIRRYGTYKGYMWTNTPHPRAKSSKW